MQNNTSSSERYIRGIHYSPGKANNTSQFSMDIFKFVPNGSLNHPTPNEINTQTENKSISNDEYMAALHRRWDISNKITSSRYIDDFDRLPDSTVFIELSHKGFCEIETPEYKGYNITCNQVYLNENCSNLDECFEAFKKALSERMHSARESKLPYNDFINIKESIENSNELIIKRYTDGVYRIIGILSISLLLTISCALQQKDFLSAVITGIKAFLMTTGALFLITLASYMIDDAFKRHRNS